MNELIQKIKELNIADVIDKVCGLSMDRTEKISCPFHDEKTPSLKIYPKTGTFKCFGCAEQGDVIEFVQKFHSLNFIGAVKLIADAYGFYVPEHEQPKRDYSFVNGYNHMADFGHFALQLDHPNSKAVMNYLHVRGLSDATISKFKLGYWNEAAFTAGKTLRDLFKDQGVAEENFVALERHCSRLLIPLYNGNGSQVLGFASRGLSKEEMAKHGKYVNDMNSDHKYGYNKSAYLFGYHVLEYKTFAFVVEGYLDAIFMHEMGYNAVGVGGTAITDTHAGVLMKKFKKIIMGFDNDKMGVYKTFENLIRFDGHDMEFVLWDKDIKDAGDLVKAKKELVHGNIIQYIIHQWKNDFNNISTDVDKRIEFCKNIIDGTKHFVPIMKAEIESVIVKLIGEFVTY